MFNKAHREGYAKSCDTVGTLSMISLVTCLVGRLELAWWEILGLIAASIFTHILSYFLRKE